MKLRRPPDQRPPGHTHAQGADRPRRRPTATSASDVVPESEERPRAGAMRPERHLRVWRAYHVRLRGRDAAHGCCCTVPTWSCGGSRRPTSSELLFDDVLCVKRARQEHDAFADTLGRGRRGAPLRATCWPRRSRTTRPGRWLLDRGRRRARARPRPGHGRPLASSTDATRPPSPATCRRHHRRRAGRRSEPPTCGRGPLHRRLRAAAASQPPVHPRHHAAGSTAVCRSTPWPSRPGAGDRARRGDLPLPPAASRRAGYPIWYGGSSSTTAPPPSRAATSSSIGRGAVLVGMGERTTPQAVEMLARGLFARRRRPTRSSRSSCRTAGRSCTSTR